jgi:hypothetical protein
MLSLQTKANIIEYNSTSVQAAEAVDEIPRLGNELWEKRKYVTKLKTQPSRKRLRIKKDVRAKGNAVSDLDERTNAQEEKAIEIRLNDAPIIKYQTKPEVGSNNQGKKQCVFHPLFED